MTYRLAGYDDDVYMISLHRYFIWDTIDAIVNFTDLGFVLHGERSFVFTHQTYAGELMGRFLTFQGMACTFVYTLTFVRDSHLLRVMLTRLC